MPLSAQALLSLAEARTYLGVSADEDPKDELLELIINGLSARIVQRTGRTYINPVAKDAESTVSYDFDPASPTVPIDDFRSVTKVEVSATPGSADSWFELADTDFYLEPSGQPVSTAIRFLEGPALPAQGVGWGALSLHRRGYSSDTMGTPWPWEGTIAAAARTTVRITGKLGQGADATTAPANVRLAVAMWLQNIHKRDQAFFSEDFGKAMAGLKMPADVEELLDGEGDRGASVQVI